MNDESSIGTADNSVDSSTDDVISIDGKAYSRTMAEQMARDIEIANTENPNSWTIYGNSALEVANKAMLAVRLPIQHGFVIDTESAPDGVDALLAPYGTVTPYVTMPTLRRITLPSGDLTSFIETFQELHERAVQRCAQGKGKTSGWQGHKRQAVEVLSQIVGRHLPQPGYINDLDHLPTPSAIAVEPSRLDVIRSQFVATGLHYTDAQVATFYTALQTKGFVVLSGISGTGKSKIATGFSEMLCELTSVSVYPQNNNRLIEITLKPYMLRGRRLGIPTKYHFLLVPMEPGTSYQLPVIIEGKQGTGRFWFRLINGREQFQLSLHQVLMTEMSKWPTFRPIYVEPVINAEGDRVVAFNISRHVPDDRNGNTPPNEIVSSSVNHLFLSVRPDWRDSTSLLGYYNPLTQTYEWTDFLRFVLRARESFEKGDGLAWFVILDEMNLAHVEYYFADLLSVIESGRNEDGLTREPLRLSYPDLLDDDVPPREVFLPPNLYVIGTVNMDETTHAFSPKVLDRAFTIELSDVDFSTYQIAPTTADAETTFDHDDRQQLLEAFTRNGRFALIDKNEIAEIVTDNPVIRARLQALNERLKPFRFHFGYRVFDEIAQYLFNNRENGMMPFDDAFDQAVFMKVLPKFNGSRARLLGPLRALLAWSVDPHDPDAILSEIKQWSAKLDAETDASIPLFMSTPAFPVTATRALQMLIALETDGFVSFG